LHAAAYEKSLRDNHLQSPSSSSDREIPRHSAGAGSSPRCTSYFAIAALEADYS
jgi:hypothetical protein